MNRFRTCTGLCQLLHRENAKLERDMSQSVSAVPDAGHSGGRGHQRPAMPALALAALGVVYGDIGTSPLYTLQTVFDPVNGLSLNALNVVGIVSLIVWSLIVVVSLKYVTLILRANNHGEGGIMALLALAASSVATRPRLRHVLLGVGIMGAALFYGDSVITPAISVLSAVEGLRGRRAVSQDLCDSRDAGCAGHIVPDAEARNAPVSASCSDR